MDNEEIKPDPELTEEQKQLVAKLTKDDLHKIDEALYSNTKNNWRKVAMVVGLTMSKLPNRIYGLPDVYYAIRVRGLVESGRLVSQGNLSYMRYSEVRRNA